MPSSETERIISLERLISGKPPETALAVLAGYFPDKIVFSTSFGWEDQAITHIIFTNNIPIRVFTLDTGRNFSETYSVWNSTIERYGKKIEAKFPNTESLQDLLAQKGPLSFYESVENRKECCNIRKVEPLKRALKNSDCWITGIRSSQSPERKGMPRIEWDQGNEIIKYHPLLDWDLDRVKEFISANNIPYNPLHDRGFLSIGCAPCTRAVKEGEDFRAGRWWWEDNSKKECGIHIK